MTFDDIGDGVLTQPHFRPDQANSCIPDERYHLPREPVRFWPLSALAQEAEAAAAKLGMFRNVLSQRRCMTTTPKAEMSEPHDRIPVILDEQVWPTWLGEMQRSERSRSPEAFNIRTAFDGETARHHLVGPPETPPETGEGH